jgi:membrane protease YdiL (CAAX protease family)
MGAALVSLFALQMVVFTVFVSPNVEGRDPLVWMVAVQAFVETPKGLLLLAGANQVSFLGTAVGTAALSKEGFVRRLRLGPSAAKPWQSALVVVGFAGLSVGGSAIVEPSGGTLEMMGKAIGEMRGAPALMAVAFGLIGVLGPLAEELLFRGVIQARFTERWGRGIAIPVAAALFGVAHMDLVQGTFAFLFGLFLGWAADRYGSLRPAILAHAVNNSFFVAAALFLSSPEGAEAETPVATRVVLAVLGLGAFAVSLAVLLRTKPRALPQGS